MPVITKKQMDGACYIRDGGTDYWGTVHYTGTNNWCITAKISGHGKKVRYSSTRENAEHRLDNYLDGVTEDL